MINDTVFIILYIITEMINYCLGYNVIFGKNFSKKKWRWIVTCFLLVWMHISLKIIYGEETSKALSMITMLVIPLCLMAEFNWKNMLLYPFVVMSTSTIAMSASFFMALCLNQPEYRIATEHEDTIIAQSIPIVILCGLLLVKKMRADDFEQIEIDFKQSVFLYIMIICIFLLLAPLQSLSIQRNGRDISIVGCSSSILCILLLVVAIWQINSSNKERKQKEINDLREKQMELQKEYYNKLIRQDELVRKFRHDLRAHIQVINAYCIEDNINKIREYLDYIIEESAINDVKMYTGNYEVDAILRSFIDSADKEKVVIDISGCIPKNSMIAVYDLCSLVYNLMKNAVEACEKIQDSRERRIVVKTGEYDSHFYLEISNTIDKIVEVNNYTISSTKSNTRNHGIGIGTVKSIIKKYGGMISASCDDTWFRVEINV